MGAWAYYNEIDEFQVEGLRARIKAGLIPPGEVDTRSIEDVSADDLRPFRQCHFFAGIAGWSEALRLAGWDDEREVWTGSCPCQPFSVAGKGLGSDDERHLWPAFYRLIAERRPATVFGEQVASALGREWLSGVRLDLEAAGYACGASNLPAAGLSAPHRRERLWWVGQADPHASKRGFGEQRLHQEDRGRGWAPTVGERPHGVGLADADERGCESERVAEPRGVEGSPGRLADGRSPVRELGDAARMADSESLGSGRRPDDEDGGRGELTPADRSPGGVAQGDASCLGRGEGWAEHGLRSGRNAPAGNGGADDIGGVAQGDTPSNGRDIECGDHRESGGAWIELEREPPNDGSGRLTSPVGVAQGNPERAGLEGHAGHGDNWRGPGWEHPDPDRPVASSGDRGFWSGAEWRTGADGKTRRVEPGLALLAHGLPPGMGKLSPDVKRLAEMAGLDGASLRRAKRHRIGAVAGYGNAIVPQVAAAFIKAVM